MRPTQTSPALEMSGHEGAPEPGSNRAFGFVFCALAAGVGLWPAIWSSPPRTWALATAAVFAVVAAVAPRRLAPLNRVWFRVGMILHRFASPVALGLVYFLAVTPTGLLLRLFGKDILSLRLDPEADSYWIVRDPPGPGPESLKNQF